MNDSEKFGAFKGVFTPSILTILGVIMYLRFGWVLGNVGLGYCLLIVTLATSITFLTALSVSALASNMRVGGGGAYYIISRSLGAEAGGSIGIWLFLSQSVGISFYAAGFAESLSFILPDINQKICAITVLVILSLITMRSADLALKTQFIILFLIVLSLVSFFSGSPPALLAEAPVVQKETFWPVFAVFFPAVTGILAGINMSGDLKDPSRSLPSGTLWAVIISYCIYMMIPVFLNNMVGNRYLLIENPLIMKDISRFPMLIYAGVWGATLSSAMGSLLGAPRTLQAMSKDKVMPKIFSVGSGKNNEPLRASLVAFLIALAGVLFGDLNVIAPLLTMFTLTSYALLNFCALAERFAGSPSWRPTFKVHWMVYAAGTMACFFAMFMINPGATFISLFISLLTYSWLRKRSLKSHWKDIRHGLLYWVVERSVFAMSGKHPGVRAWRPNILVFTGSPTSRWYLVTLADAVASGRGILTVATVLSEAGHSDDRIKSIQNTLEEYLKNKEVRSFVKVIQHANVYEAMLLLVKNYGFGPVIPNTVILGQCEQDERLVDFIRVIREAVLDRKNVIVVQGAKEENCISRNSRIDVWWNQKSRNGALSLAMAYMLDSSPDWKESRLLLRTIVSSEDDYSNAEQYLQSFIKRSRIDADYEISSLSGSSPFDLICEKSADADFVFIGLRAPENDEKDSDYAEYYRYISRKLMKLPPTGFVLAAADVEFRNLFC